MKTFPIRCRISDDSEVTRIDVYDDIGDGLFGGVSAADFANRLTTIRGPLAVHINSGGGNVFEGVAIHEALRGYRGRVTVHVDGIAASIASVIAQAGTERVMAPGSMMMIHDASTITEGNQRDHEKAATVLSKVSDTIARTYSQRAGGTVEFWRDAMRDESWYTAEEAVAAGLADRVAGEVATWPSGLELAAFGAAPDKIMNGMRRMEARGALRLRNAVMHGDHELYDPDGDGDCDACPEGDTDHDFWAPDGTQLKSVPGKPMPGEGDDGGGKKKGKKKAHGGRGFRAEGVDNSPWDAGKAWHNGATSDNPATFYAAICAGRRDGDPAKQGSWALPYRYTPSSPPNAAAVRNALARLDSTEGLTNKDAAKSKLEGLMRKINPDYEPGDTIDTAGISSLLLQTLGRGK